MKFNIDKDFLHICKKIVEEDLNLEEWAEIESDDMFQEGAFTGGYDADEEAFCFSFYEGKAEYWFQVTMLEIEQILSNQVKTIDMYLPDL